MLGEVFGYFFGYIASGFIQVFSGDMLELGWSKGTFKSKLFWVSFIILNIVMFAFVLIFKWPIAITEGLLLFLISSLLSFLTISFCWGIWRFIKHFKKCKI
ncbi:hypothetical protein B6D19_01095 [Gilliamella apicola]|nr:hypothetical protein B6D19_01095 [Gilliamella apicola]OTQ44306.1 hypothetical protein B6D20_06540 [Gilliamella apicola]